MIRVAEGKFEPPCSHDAAMDTILAASGMTTLSYEEAIAVYLRLRGFLQDGALPLAAELPAGFCEPQRISDRASNT